MTTAMILKPLSRHSHALLTTYAADGLRPESVQVRFVVDADRIVVDAPRSDAIVARVSDHPTVDITPCNLRGHPQGAPVRARAWLLHADEARYAAQLLNRAHPVRLTQPLTLRRRLGQRLYFALRPQAEQDNECPEGAPE